MFSWLDQHVWLVNIGDISSNLMKSHSNPIKLPSVHPFQSNISWNPHSIPLNYHLLLLKQLKPLNLKKNTIIIIIINLDRWSVVTLPGCPGLIGPGAHHRFGPGQWRGRHPLRAMAMGHGWGEFAPDLMEFHEGLVGFNGISWISWGFSGM